MVLLLSLAGAPLSSISVSSYYLAAQVSFPANEVLSVGIMNGANKIVTFMVVIAGSSLEPKGILPLWASLALTGVIPGWMLFKKHQIRKSQKKDQMPLRSSLDKAGDRKSTSNYGTM
jgi:hypothetical protein